MYNWYLQCVEIMEIFVTRMTEWVDVLRVTPVPSLMTLPSLGRVFVFSGSQVSQFMTLALICLVMVPLTSYYR